MRKRMMAYLLTAAMTCSLAAPAAFGASLAKEEPQAVLTETEAENQTTSEMVWNAVDPVWETDTKMHLTQERSLMAEAKMSIREWDEAVEAKKDEGREAPVTKEAILKADPDAQILEKDGSVYYLGSTDVPGEITDAKEAYRAAYSLLPLMDGNELADLRLWHVMEINGLKIYSFQQISEGKMVLGSTMKIAVKDHKISAVFGSLDPEAGMEENIAAQTEVEDVVKEELEKKGEQGEILTDATDRIRFSPYALEDLNLESGEDDPVPEEVRWVVYTRNDNTVSAEAAEEKEYPYIAHYVDLAGTYLYSLPVEEIGDDEALCGYRKQKAFDGMRGDFWTGEIKGYNDETHTVTLPVMKDESGRWYLGDVERRIAVADFSDAVYGEDHALNLVESSDNRDWDNEDLFMYFNYLLAWQFYDDMGWTGPDGAGTDVIILKDMCTRDGTPFENACSVGLVQGWQMFGYTAYGADGRPLRLGHGLDVMAHEYTHTFTSTIMNSNLYENDQGAINEAMSDIMGNLTEQILERTEDTRWLLGEQTGTAIRNMSDPGACQQPAYVWDEFYGPATETPSDANDRGGVHVNSSLLNRIAAKLCLDYGMEYNDAVRFWVMAAGGLTPKTDYEQIPAVLNWAASLSGNESQKENLDTLIEEERLDQKELPQKLPYGDKIVHLKFPDTEAFEDENWVLVSFSLNMDTVGNLSVAAVQMVAQLFKDAGDNEEIGRILSELLNHLHLDENKIRLDKTSDEDAVADAIAQVLTYVTASLIEQKMAWSDVPGGDITFVTDNDPTLYTLLNISDSGTKLNACSALVGSRWIDLTPLLEKNGSMENLLQENGETETETEMSPDSILDALSNITPEEWAILTEAASAVEEMVHGSGEEEAQSETEEKEISAEDNDLVEYALALLEYVSADEKTREMGLMLPAKTEELPTEGLEKLTLVKE